MAAHGSYGPYGGYEDPYRIPENSGALGAYEAMLNGQTYLAGLDAAENPQYQYVLDPATGQPVRFGDGTPVVERIPMEQRMAPIVRHQMARHLRMKLLMLLGPALFGLYVAVVVFSPKPVGDFLQDYFLPVLAYIVVWGGILSLIGIAVVAIVRAAWIAIKTPPWRD